MEELSALARLPGDVVSQPVVDPGGKLRYHGRIDDQYGIGYQRPKASKTYLADAIEAVLAGNKVAEAKVAVEGCYITKAPATKSAGSVTYAKHVAPLLADDIPEVRQSAASILVAIGPPAVDELVRLLQGDSAAMRIPLQV